MSRSRIRRPAAVIVVVLLQLALLPGLVLAGTQGSCLAGDTTKLRLWENTIGDTQDNNDTLWLCNSDTDLSNNDHSLPGNCEASPFDKFEWNDCVSSVSIYLPSGWCVDFFRDPGQGANMNNTVQGPASGVRINLPYNDQLSGTVMYTC